MRYIKNPTVNDSYGAAVTYRIQRWLKRKVYEEGRAREAKDRGTNAFSRSHCPPMNLIV